VRLIFFEAAYIMTFKQEQATFSHQHFTALFARTLAPWHVYKEELFMVIFLYGGGDKGIL
jgi:hypothetical protein